MYPLKEKIIPTEVALVLHGILMSSVNLVLFESTDQLNEPFFGFVGGGVLSSLFSMGEMHLVFH